jgi:hypothetical protein
MGLHYALYLRIGSYCENVNWAECLFVIPQFVPYLFRNSAKLYEGIFPVFRNSHQRFLRETV